MTHTKRIVAVNGSPRAGWNTASLVAEAARGAQSVGAEVERFDLYRLEKYTGCISCFGCKRAPNEGVCVCRDGLKPVLDAIRGADGLILGTPNYLGDISAGTRALYERLIFQTLTYRREVRSYSDRAIPMLFIMTSNAPESLYREGGYGGMIANYRETLSAFVGPTEVLLSTDTLQVNDYDRYNWTMFDPEAKKARREVQFPRDLEAAFRQGVRLGQA